MTLPTLWPAVAATLRAAHRAIARAPGPARVSVPFCVSHGRVVFCLHGHEPRASQAADAQALR